VRGSTPIPSRLMTRPGSVRRAGCDEGQRVHRGPLRCRRAGSSPRTAWRSCGAGFGGLFAAKALRGADVDVTVIDRTNHHLFQPLLYQMATGILSEGDIAPPIRDVLRRQRNTSVTLGEVEGIDLDGRRLTVNTLGLRSEIPYDSLIIATGAKPVVLRPPGVRARRPRNEDDRRRARTARADLRRVRDGRAREPDPNLRSAWPDVRRRRRRPDRCRARGTDRRARPLLATTHFRRIDPTDARIVLVDAAPRILGSFPESSSDAPPGTRADGVEIHLGAMVTGVDGRGINTNAEIQACDGSRP